MHVLIRLGGLVETISRYLIRRIEDNPEIVLRTCREIVALAGSANLKRVRLRDNRSGEIEAHDIRHVFLMTGAVSSTQWLGGCLALDDKGFIKTGPELSQDDLIAAQWSLARTPYFMETGIPAVLAVGDVRLANVKRLASVVGEGGNAVAMLHRVLNE